jgi:hypothetical protein
MKQDINRIVENILKSLMVEQDATNDRETDNAPSDAVDSPFTPAEEKFLGKFDAYGSTHLGIIYSVSDTGIREFMMRSGRDLNLTVGTLLSLLRQKVIKIVTYTGFGRNNDYTIELQLSLDDVKGLGTADKEQAEKGGATPSSADADMSATLPTTPEGPAPDLAWVINYGDLLSESAKITKKLLKTPLKEAKKSDIEIYIDNSRLLKRFPKEFVYHLRRMLTMMDKKTKTKLEKERLIADILDNLQVNMKLSPQDIRKSYEFHKNQKRLQKVLNKDK